MNLFKRAAALLVSAATLLTCASCGENTATAMNVDGFDVRAGIYLYYTVSAYNDAISVLSDGGEKFENCKTTKDIKKIMSKANIDGITAEEWIQNKAETYCANYVAVEKEFDRLGLELSGNDIAEIDSSTQSSFVYFGEFFNDTGIGEQSIKDIITSSYKQEAIWESYYGEDGSMDIQDDELYQYYADNRFRIKYIEMPLKDGEGNLLKADGKEEIEAMANDYLARLEKKSGSEKELMKEFDYLIEEHKNYVTSLSKAAVTTTDDKGNTITTETTTKATTTDSDSADATTDPDSTETTTAPEETGDTTETTTIAAENTDETTTTETTAETTTDATAEVTDKTTDTTDTTETTVSTTTNALGYDTANERIITRVSTENEEQSEGTTTEPNYTPCEKVYNWAVNSNPNYLKPELIKDDECYYIVVKMDIEDRMIDSDLWTSSTKESVRETLYYEDFLDMLNDVADKMNVDRNEKAFKRYKVLDVDVVGYQAAVYQSYYSMYGLS